MANTEQPKSERVQAYLLIPVDPVGDPGGLVHVSATQPASPQQPFKRVLINPDDPDMDWIYCDHTGGGIPKSAVIDEFTEAQWEAAITFAHFYARRALVNLRAMRSGYKRDLDSY